MLFRNSCKKYKKCTVKGETTGLPTAVLQQVLFGYHDLQDAETLAKASDEFAEAYEKPLQKAREIAILLEYVAKGKQIQAEALLKINPNLLLFKGDVIDYSERKFINIQLFNTPYGPKIDICGKCF